MEDSELSGAERCRSDDRRGTVAQTDRMYMASEDLSLKAAKAPSNSGRGNIGTTVLLATQNPTLSSWVIYWQVLTARRDSHGAKSSVVSFISALMSFFQYVKCADLDCMAQ